MAVTTSQPSEYTLTPAQKSHFLTHGFVKIPKCFTPLQAAEFTRDLWPRLGISPTDKSTWTEERINMPFHHSVNVEEFAPRAWSAMCQLLGGEERISDQWRNWNDGFIVNFGKEEYSPDEEVNFKELDGWHSDGDFFIHHLDSPEQALLVIPLWSNISSKGGATALCSDSLTPIAKHLHAHPEGVSPWMISTSDPTALHYEGRTFLQSIATAAREDTFHEATGEVGDVYLMHPLMLHSASKNLTRELRVITNPPVALKEPFCFDRSGKSGKSGKESEYSLVERVTLRALGVDGEEGLRGWKVEEGRRGGWTPRRLRVMEEMKRLEIERLASLKKTTAEGE